jgi:hypothetical protein
VIGFPVLLDARRNYIPFRPRHDLGHHQSLLVIRLKRLSIYQFSPRRGPKFAVEPTQFHFSWGLGMILDQEGVLTFVHVPPIEPCQLIGPASPAAFCTEILIEVLRLVFGWMAS